MGSLFLQGMRLLSPNGMFPHSLIYHKKSDRTFLTWLIR